jgi:hypothetical protein
MVKERYELIIANSKATPEIILRSSYLKSVNVVARMARIVTVQRKYITRVIAFCISMSFKGWSRSGNGVHKGF